MSSYRNEEHANKKRESATKYYHAHKERVKASNEKWYEGLSEEDKRKFIQKRKDKAKKWRKNHPPDRRDRRGERFGISPEQYELKRNQQRKDGDLCGLCKRPLGKVRAHLDHDHSTNKLRDFIHRNCNLAIGLLEDDPKLCHLAAEYLEKHGDQNVRI